MGSVREHHCALSESALVTGAGRAPAASARQDHKGTSPGLGRTPTKNTPGALAAEPTKRLSKRHRSFKLGFPRQQFLECCLAMKFLLHMKILHKHKKTRRRDHCDWKRMGRQAHTPHGLPSWLHLLIPKGFLGPQGSLEHSVNTAPRADPEIKTGVKHLSANF